MLEWIIIGGGIQGMTMAAFLLKSGKTTVDQLAMWIEMKNHWQDGSIVRKSFQCHIYVHHPYIIWM